MVYEVPESDAAPFEYKVARKKYSVAKLSERPPSDMVLVFDALKAIIDDNADGIERVRAMGGLCDLFGPAGTPAGDAVRTLSGERLMGLVTAYAADSGLTLGESEASSDS